MSTDEKLIHMANQIADFFKAQGHDRAVKGIADHLQKFWEPHMRARIIEIAADYAKTINPLVAEALPLLKAPAR